MRRVARREDVVVRVVDLKARDPRKRASRSADLRREVGQRRKVVAEERGLAREAPARELHAVAGVAGEPDDHVLELLDGLGHRLFGRYSSLLQAVAAAGWRRTRYVKYAIVMIGVTTKAMRKAMDRTSWKLVELELVERVTCWIQLNSRPVAGSTSQSVLVPLLSPAVKEVEAKKRTSSVKPRPPG